MWVTKKKMLKEIKKEQEGLLSKVSELENSIGIIAENIRKSEDRLAVLMNENVQKLQQMNKEEMIQGKEEVSKAVSKEKEDLINQIVIKQDMCRNDLVKSLSELLDEILADVKGYVKLGNEDILSDIKTAREELLHNVKMSGNKEDLIENLGSINSSLLEVLSYLMALDEGNRLIIANLLLKDLE